jgi:hypothetical protein
LSTVNLPRRYSRVVQLELNEISRDLIERLVSKGRLPNFRRLLQDWTYIQTESETEYDLLEPWIQWTSVHTGEPFSGHGIFRLSDADRLHVSQIWEVLSQRGIESAIIGSLNAVRGSANGGMFFPDPWSKRGLTHPPQLQSLWDLLSRKVQGHATDSVSLEHSFKGALEFVKLKLPVPIYGLILAEVFNQAWDKKQRWRLASAFDAFLTAIFVRTLRQTRFGFYTLFLNSAAHYQHHYWRNHEREKFSPKIISPDCHVTDDPVAHGYERFDQILAQVLEAAQDGNTLVIVASGLSQTPYTQKENEGGMNYYRLKNHVRFVQQMQIHGVDVFPLMSRDWQLCCHSANDFDRAWHALSSLQVENEKLFRLESNRENHIFIETAVTRALPKAASITGHDGPAIVFSDVFSCIAIKSGHHHDKGSVWVSIPKGEWSVPPTMPVWNLFHIALRALLGTEESVHASRHERHGVRA